MFPSRSGGICALAIVLVSIFIVGARGGRMKRVAGGTIVAPGEYKNMVGIFLTLPYAHDIKFLCSGTIMSDRHILTAAHCIDYDASELVVAAGVNDFTDNRREMHAVEEVITHPDWKMGNDTVNGFLSIAEHDIGLILLQESLISGLNSQSLQASYLPHRQMPIGESCIGVGAGRTFRSEIGKSVLYKMKQSLVMLEKCDKPHGIITYGFHWLCAHNGFSASCPGDSGGPLMCQGYVVGIASAASCSRDSPTLYSNAYYYKQWILDTIYRVNNKTGEVGEAKIEVDYRKV